MSRMPIGVLGEAEHGQRTPLLFAEAGVRSLLAHTAEAPGDRLERVVEIAPARRRVGPVVRKRAAGAIPARERALRVLDLVRAHAIEEIIFRVVLANMVEAQEAPASRSVEIRGLQRRLELAGRGAARGGALRPRPLDPPVHPGLLRRH